jgi:hypothetical protein
MLAPALPASPDAGFVQLPEDIRWILPLPIARLLRRAQNSKSPKERHDTAFYAWEASVRLAAARTPHMAADALAAPALGSFVQVVASADVSTTTEDSPQAGRVTEGSLFALPTAR